MDLKELVNRNNSVPMEQQEALFVIKKYVEIRKGVEVRPIVESSRGHYKLMQELSLMQHMLTDSITWFRQNPEKMDS